jgi:negative regulator of flagellin synthesis FlgM
MRIDANNRLRETGDAGSAGQASQRATSGAAGQSLLGNDTAELSTDQVRVQSLAAEVNQLPEVRQEKVAALSSAVREGTYNVSPEQTAEAMVAEMQSRFAA